jgi:hypothetical protein
MKTRVLWIVFLAVLTAVYACRSSSQSPAPPGPGPRTGTAPPVAPNPNPAPPSPPPPTALPISVPTPAPLAAAVPDQPAVATDTAPAPAEKSYAEILRLKEAGRSDEFLLAKIRTENVNYHLTTSDVQSLRAAGVSQPVLEAMLRSGQAAAR